MNLEHACKESTCTRTLRDQLAVLRRRGCAQTRGGRLSLWPEPAQSLHIALPATPTQSRGSPSRRVVRRSGEVRGARRDATVTRSAGAAGKYKPPTGSTARPEFLADFSMRRTWSADDIFT